MTIRSRTLLRQALHLLRVPELLHLVLSLAAYEGMHVLQARCNVSDPNAINAYVYGYDFGNSTRSAFTLGLWYNNTNALNNTSARPPAIQRVNAVRCPQCASAAGGLLLGGGGYL